MLRSTASLDTSRHPSSPSHSQHAHLPPTSITITTLITWLLAAKRSLTSIHHVHRATTILAEARTTIEGTTALLARTKYLRRSLTTQVKTLRAIQFELEGTAQAVKSDIQATLRQLEDVEGVLYQNLEALKTTFVEQGFRPAGVGREDDAAEKETLYGFVDDKPVGDLRRSIDATLAIVRAAQESMDASIRGLEDELQSVNEALAERTATSSATKSELQVATIPMQLRGLETNAREMAQSLEGLVSHFDLCVTAVKNTEGGGAAFAQTVRQEDLPEGVDMGAAFEKADDEIDEEEREEMLRVLATDAAEVDEVVVELQERAAEMEVQLGRIATWRENAELGYREVAFAFRRLEKLSTRLPDHVNEVNRLSVSWAEEKVRLEDIIVGTEELTEVYENFLHAYDGMIVEAARRKGVRKRIDKIIADAQAQIDQLYEDDMQEREVFRTEQGNFLPSDIWAGLSDLPSRFAFARLDADGEPRLSTGSGQLDSIPDLPKESVSAALKRLKATQGLQGSR